MAFWAIKNFSEKGDLTFEFVIIWIDYLQIFLGISSRALIFVQSENVALSIEEDSEKFEAA